MLLFHSITSITKPPSVIPHAFHTPPLQATETLLYPALIALSC
jgi:hypothetical protein